MTFSEALYRLGFMSHATWVMSFEDKRRVREHLRAIEILTTARDGKILCITIEEREA